MNNQKGNLYLIIAIIVGVVAIGVTGFASWKYFGGGSELEKEKFQPSYLFEEETILQTEEQEEIISSKKADETTDWESYENEEYGYEIKYPKSWNLAEVNKNPFNMTIWEGDGLNKDNIQMVEIYGFVSRGSIKDNLDYLKKRLKTEFNKMKEISITNGRGFYWINETKGGSSPSIYLVGKNHLFLMTYNIFEDTENALVQSELIFNQILSTFKFIGSNKISDLEIYEKDIFSLKYSSEIWSLRNNRLFHKEIGDSCMIIPGALWRQSLIEIVESINTTFNGYEARQVKLGTENEVSIINIYFDENLLSKEFSLSLPKDKQGKQTCENDFKEVISTIEFEK